MTILACGLRTKVLLSRLQSLSPFVKIQTPRDMKVSCNSNISNVLESMTTSEIKGVFETRERTYCRQLAVKTFKIVGVTFEGRQKHIAALRKGQGVMLEKEPQNIYDSNAVAVRTTDGVSLGHIGRHETGEFSHSICFGHIEYVGESAQGTWGASLVCQPKVPPLVPLAIPTNLLEECSSLCHKLDASGSDAWKTHKESILRSMNNKCVLTGASTDVVDARWRVDPATKTVNLLNFMPLHPLVTAIQYVQSNTGSLFDLCKMIAWGNDISEKEAVEFFSRQVLLAEDRRIEGWQLDLGALDHMNLR